MVVLLCVRVVSKDIGTSGLCLLFGDMNSFFQAANNLELICKPEWHSQDEE
jgi:hypothetical protein